MALSEPPDDSSPSSLGQDLLAGLGFFLSLFWFHRWPKETSNQRARYIGLALFGLFIASMLYYWIAH